MEAVLTLSTDERDRFDVRAWTTVVAYGLRIGLGADTKAGLDQLKSILPPGARPAGRSSVDISYAVRAATSGTGEPASEEVIGYADGQVLMPSSNYRTVLQAIERHLQLHLAEYAPRRVFIHAGVVAWKGQAVVIPGRSHSGKSTLVAALLRAGATYYSDEFAVLDPFGRIHPYAQPIQLRDASGKSEGMDPAEFSARVGRGPLKTRLVLVTRHREGVQWRPRRISPGEGMLALLANTVSARRDPDRALRSLNRMLVGAAVLKGSRGEAQSLVERLVRSGYLPA